MVDFVLKQENREIGCRFVTNAKDFELPDGKKWIGRPGHGNVIKDGDRISIRATMLERANVIVYRADGTVRINVMLDCGRPKLHSTKDRHHYLSAVASNKRYVLYRLPDRNDRSWILIQRFDVGGRYQNFEPDFPGVIDYSDPLDPASGQYVPGTPAVKFFQDDEGSGEEPLP